MKSQISLNFVNQPFYFKEYIMYMYCKNVYTEVNGSILDECFHSTTTYRKQREEFFIQAFQTKFKGMNKKLLTLTPTRRLVPRIFLFNLYCFFVFFSNTSSHVTVEVQPANPLVWVLFPFFFFYLIIIFVIFSLTFLLFAMFF